MCGFIIFGFGAQSQIGVGGVLRYCTFTFFSNSIFESSKSSTMKWSNAVYLLALVFLLSVLLTQAASNKKEVPSTKHKPVKPHKSVLGHWEASSGSKTKVEHHNVKDVQKHAPLTVSHHEAKSQVDLTHNKKKPLHGSGSKSDLKLQDLTVDDAVHHKVQAHKSHSSHDNHNHNVHHQNGHKMPPMKMTNNHASHERLGTAAKPEKSIKPSKKMLLNKNKKIKRTKRLHKQYIF